MVVYGLGQALYITRKCLCLIGVGVELSNHGIANFIMKIGEFVLKEFCWET